MDSNGIAVCIIEDHAATRERLEGAVRGAPPLRLAGSADSLASGRRLLAATTPDVVLVDLDLPDGSGLDLIRETSRKLPAADSMVISIFGDVVSVLAALEAGATGYLLKDSDDDDIVKHILALRAGGSPISPQIARLLLQRMNPTPTQARTPTDDEEALTKREHEVLRLLARGHTYGETAERLHLSVHTINSHIKKIYRKLAVGSCNEAVFAASRRGLLDLDRLV